MATISESLLKSRILLNAEIYHDESPSIPGERGIGHAPKYSSLLFLPCQKESKESKNFIGMMTYTGDGHQVYMTHRITRLDSGGYLSRLISPPEFIGTLKSVFTPGSRPEMFTSYLVRDEAWSNHGRDLSDEAKAIFAVFEKQEWNRLPPNSVKFSDSFLI